jgi:hypothetical protein
VGIAIVALTIDSSNRIFALKASYDIKYFIQMPSKKKKKDKTKKKKVLVNDDNILVGQKCYEFIFTISFLKRKKKRKINNAN